MKKIISLILFNILIVSSVFATHMRAGEITWTWTGRGLTFDFEIDTYTYTLSPADRPSYDVDMGDGTILTFTRFSKTQFGPASDEISKNVYLNSYTYIAPDTYIISLSDPNRNAGIVNIPNSVNVIFYIDDTLVISPFNTPPSSPQLLNPPIDNGCVGVPFYHNPNAYDANRDSISYSLIPCKGEDGLNIPGYTPPLTSSYFGINPITGELTWNHPEQQGAYNVAILIKAWRYGQVIGTITRDMQIEIATCNVTQLPIIAALRDTCILEGTLLKMNIKATDSDGDLFILSGTGGPLEVSNPATFDSVTGTGTLTSLFSWQTDCSNVQEQPYQMVFEATDYTGTVPIMNMITWRITVVAPAPPNLVASPMGNNINLIWNKSPCSNAIGYKIYRRSGFYGYIHGPCETGVPAYTGYVEIASFTGINDTTFTDTNNGNGLVHGIDYCYMVIAYFNDGAESYASNEACTTLIKDVPIITNVSVNHTDAANGSIYVAWSKPTALDTTGVPGPFKYLIYHSNNLYGTSLTLKDSLSGLNDTTYIDTLINTVATPWSYRIDLWNATPGNRYLIGTTEIASSIYLTFTPSNNKLVLNFSPNVPWVNDTFVVYRKNNATPPTFDSIGYSLTTKYTDAGLADGRTYCYKVKSIGSYFAPGLINPIINYSQENCGIPIDNIPPCAPYLTVVPNCDSVQNTLTWTDPNHSCANDVVHYHIYYTPVENGDYTLLATINNALDTTYLHQNLNSIAGCYVVTALDTFNVESSFSNVVCVDTTCYLYHLPNVFTPNGDNYNDLFVPFHPYDFVQKIDIHIYNRWGRIVYTTDDPEIKWDGKDKDTKLDCSDGVYFYVCDVYEYRLQGIKKRNIHGYVQILR